MLYNDITTEGISTTATIQLNGKNCYIQDITLKNDFDYNGTTGRAVVIQDRGDKNIFKNVTMLSFQDTYYSNNNSMRSYLEDCQINGTVDFICGGGDIVFKRNTLYLEDRANNVIVAPAGNTQWGYVFLDCIIDGYSSNEGSYYLGRPWQNQPKTAFINTTMKVIPAAAGWTNMSPTAIPYFVEYNSKNSNGTDVNTDSRRTEYDGGKIDYNPVLTFQEASVYTVENVLKGNDTWLPELATEQEAAPSVSIVDGKLSWADSKYAMLYAVVKNGQVVEFTTDNSYEIPSDVISAEYSVRSANEMGGLGLISNIVSYPNDATSIDKNEISSEVVSKEYFTVDGMRLDGPVKGINIIRYTMDNGQVVVRKEMMK